MSHVDRRRRRDPDCIEYGATGALDFSSSSTDRPGFWIQHRLGLSYRNSPIEALAGDETSARRRGIRHDQDLDLDCPTFLAGHYLALAGDGSGRYYLYVHTAAD